MKRVLCQLGRIRYVCMQPNNSRALDAVYFPSFHCKIRFAGGQKSPFSPGEMRHILSVRHPVGKREKKEREGDFALFSYILFYKTPSSSH